MPIEIKLIEQSHLGYEDLYCPFFVCDVCNKTIHKSGNYIFKVKNQFPNSSIFYVHKQCTNILERTYPEDLSNGELWHSWRLDQLPLFLLSNLTDTDLSINTPLNLYLAVYGVALSDWLEIDRPELNTRGLYFLFDNKSLVYIGQSSDIQKRLSTNHHIYQSFHKIRIAQIFNQQEREDLEKALITLLKPELNTVHK